MVNHYDAFKKADCEIYAISTDSHFAHKAWHDSSETIGKVQFPMVGDPNAKLAKDFEVYIKEAGQAHRGTFIIGPDLEVMAYEVNAPGLGRNATELIRKVIAAQYITKNKKEVAPANWKPGDATLKPGIDLVGKL